MVALASDLRLVMDLSVDVGGEGGYSCRIADLAGHQKTN